MARLELDGRLLVDGGLEAGGVGLGIGLGVGLVWLGQVALLDIPIPLSGSDIVVNHDLPVLVFVEVVEDIVCVGRVLEDNVSVCGHVGLGVEWRGLLGEGEVDAFDGFDNVCVEENESHMFLCVSLANAWNNEGHGSLLDFGNGTGAVHIEGRCILGSVVIDGCTPREGRFAGDVGEKLGEVTPDDLPESLGVCLVILDLEGFSIVHLIADGVCLVVVKPVEEVDVDGCESAGDIALVACELDVVNVAEVEFAEDGEHVLASNGEVDTGNAEGRVEGVCVDPDLKVMFAFDGGGDVGGEVEDRRNRRIGGTRLGGGIGCVGVRGHFVRLLGFLKERMLLVVGWFSISIFLSINEN